MGDAGKGCEPRFPSCVVTCVCRIGKGSYNHCWSFLIGHAQPSQSYVKDPAGGPFSMGLRNYHHNCPAAFHLALHWGNQNNWPQVSCCDFCGCSPELRLQGDSFPASVSPFDLGAHELQPMCQIHVSTSPLSRNLCWKTITRFISPLAVSVSTL